MPEFRYGCGQPIRVHGSGRRAPSDRDPGRLFVFLGAKGDGWGVRLASVRWCGALVRRGGGVLVCEAGCREAAGDVDAVRVVEPDRRSWFPFRGLDGEWEWEMGMGNGNPSSDDGFGFGVRWPTCLIV